MVSTVVAIVVSMVVSTGISSVVVASTVVVGASVVLGLLKGLLPLKGLLLRPNGLPATPGLRWITNQLLAYPPDPDDKVSSLVVCEGGLTVGGEGKV